MTSGRNAPMRVRRAGASAPAFMSLAMLIGALMRVRRAGALAPASMLLAIMLSVHVSMTAAQTGNPQVLDLDGRRIDPFGQDARAVVMLFVSVDCPISNRYAPEVRRLTERFSSLGVKFWLVYPNPHENAPQIRAHLSSFGYIAAALRDPRQELATYVGATVTPEAAVFDARRQRVYRGRIDDRYISLGRERPSPTRHDLSDALAATLAGHAVVQPETQAVGCFIADFAHGH